jgi:hypothetical protein
VSGWVGVNTPSFCSDKLPPITRIRHYDNVVRHPRVILLSPENILIHIVFEFNKKNVQNVLHI